MNQIQDSNPGCLMALLILACLLTVCLSLSLALLVGM